MEVLFYTFRTNKYAKKFKDIFIFGKLKEDLVAITKLIQKERPKYIIGLADLLSLVCFIYVICNE